MKANNVKLVVVNGKKIVKTLNVEEGHSGAPVKVKGFSGAKFILENEDGFAPENITTTRVGNDLLIRLEGSTDPDIVIEGYYGQDASLVGRAEDNVYYAYIASDAEPSHFVSALSNGETAAQVLGRGTAVDMAGLVPGTD